MINNINASEIQSVTSNFSGLSVVQFGAAWCQACQAIKPGIETMSTNVPEVQFLYMDADKNVDFVTKLGVKSLPSFAFYKNGSNVAIEKGLNITTLRFKVDELK